MNTTHWCFNVRLGKSSCLVQPFVVQVYILTVVEPYDMVVAGHTRNMVPQHVACPFVDSLLQVNQLLTLAKQMTSAVDSELLWDCSA
jgi:hypothetical protein